MEGKQGPAAAIAATAARFSGRFALCACHLGTGEEIAHEADTVFHSASTIKLAILTALLSTAEAGEISLDRTVTVPAEGRTGGSGVLAALADAARLTVRDLAVLMTVVSDNTATNAIIDMVGVDRVNALIDRLGLPGLRLNRKVRTAGSAGAEGGVPFGTASARGLCRLLVLLSRGEAAPPRVCAAVLAILKKQQQNLLLTRCLPGWEEYPQPDSPQVASKSGRIRGVHHDAGLVWHRGVAYAIAIMSDGCQDRRYHPDNEALVELPRLSLAVYRHWLGEER